MKNPCSQDCPERTGTCHGECERYTAFRKSREPIYEAAKRRTEFIDFQKDTHQRMVRKYHLQK